MLRAAPDAEAREKPSARAWAIIEIRGTTYMTAVHGEIAWGATVDELRARDQKVEWAVELRSESLRSYAVDTALARFAEDASRLGAVESCSLTLGHFAMRVTIRARAAEEAADAATDLFTRILETAVWPRALPTPFVPCEVAVRPADPR